MKNGSLAVYVKITASHHFDDLRLFHLFRIGSAPRFTSCPYGTEPLPRRVFFRGGRKFAPPGSHALSRWVYCGRGRERERDVSLERRRVSPWDLRHRPGVRNPHRGHLPGGGAAVSGRVPSHRLRLRLLPPPLKGEGFHEDRCLEIAQGPAGPAAQALPRGGGVTAKAAIPLFSGIPEMVPE